MKNISQDDIKSLVYEWFCDCTTTVEAALLYGELYHEIQLGLKERMQDLEATNEQKR